MPFMLLKLFKHIHSFDGILTQISRDLVLFLSDSRATQCLAPRASCPSHPGRPFLAPQNWGSMGAASGELLAGHRLQGRPWAEAPQWLPWNRHGWCPSRHE